MKRKRSKISTSCIKGWENKVLSAIKSKNVFNILLSYLGSPVDNKDGVYFFVCPFTHNINKIRAVGYLQWDTKKNKFSCSCCNKKGNLIDLIFLINNYPAKREAIFDLSNIFRISVPWIN